VHADVWWSRGSKEIRYATRKHRHARVKQAGATSIGRYYSSSDGKYYGNFNELTKHIKQEKQNLEQLQ
jgi:hypothetical protein